MPDLYSTIKRIALAAVEESHPTAVMVGTVTKTDPLKVTVEQRLPLDDEFFIVPKRLKGSFKAGDGLLMLREQGGQRYVVLDIL